ncbi:hypothetical protein E2562_029461 [Oryza meyeriana var. granulata]|uniref:Uncharacterized protein n=1 Tax=Oryza meyeriana var. granulata TaxID=110450 RepID=A0A6G1E3T4_9ORYZ|nr:hypothetical protein E2562_029461 [Oryza meyeriana var. granulata]
MSKPPEIRAAEEGGKGNLHVTMATPLTAPRYGRRKGDLRTTDPCVVKPVLLSEKGRPCAIELTAP